ncbi:endonuclease/exonuclease/phosphatase family protein [Nanoarchaeota archaeon]
MNNDPDPEAQQALSRRNFFKLAAGGIGTALISFYLVGHSPGCAGAQLITLGNSCQKQPTKKKVRVASYNIANARGNTIDFWHTPTEKEVKENLEQIVDFARREDIDVLCMNEVDFNSQRTHNLDQARYIADRLCYNHVIEEAIFSAPPYMKLGNAVVSRYPLKLNGHYQFGRNFSQRLRHMFKSFVDFDVLLPDRLNFILTHYDAESETVRREETKQILKHIKKKKQPFVLLGDFNAGPGKKSFDRLIRSGYVRNPYTGILTYPADRPRESIDHILVSPQLNIRNYHSVHLEPSDHRPIIGDIYR